MLPGLFVGYALYAGRIWKEDVSVDIEDLENLDASEIYARRLHAKEIIAPNSGENSVFPNEDGTVKLSG